MTKLRRILKCKTGNGFPLVVAITLALVLILCGVMEFFRLNIIASGVKEALQDAIIVTVNDNYADVYHGVREGYSGGYQPDGSSFSYSVNTGDIYSYMDSVLGMEEVSGSHVKYSGKRSNTSCPAWTSRSAMRRWLLLRPEMPSVLRLMPQSGWRCRSISGANSSQP